MSDQQAGLNFDVKVGQNQLDSQLDAMLAKAIPKINNRNPAPGDEVSYTLNAQQLKQAVVDYVRRTCFIAGNMVVGDEITFMDSKGLESEVVSVQLQTFCTDSTI